MNRFGRTALSVFMVSALLFGLAACGKDKPKFKTQAYTGEQASFEIPADWEQITSTDAQGGILVFAQSGERPATGFNNVSVQITPSDQKAPRLEDVETTFKENFEPRTKEKLPDAMNFAYNSYEAKNGTVFTASYQCAMMGKDMTITVYYPLLDSVSLYLTACKNAEDKILPDDVAKHVIDTFVLGGAQVPESKS